MVKVGICGVGRWGQNHVRVWSEILGKENVTIYDANEDSLTNISNKFGVNRARDIKDLIYSCDAIVIATPTPSHETIANAAITSNKDVLVEKPMAASLSSAIRLSKLAKHNGQTLMVDNLLMFHPAFAKIKEMVKSGEIGDIVCVDSIRNGFGVRVYGEDVISGVAIHDLYIVDNLIGPIKRISAIGRSIARTFPDIGIDDVSIFGDTVDEKGFRINSSWATGTKTRIMSVIGTKKTVVWNDVVKERQLSINNGFIDGNNVVPPTEEIIVEVDKSEPLKNMALDFINRITHRLPGNHMEGIRALQLVEAAKDSVCLNMPVTLS